MNIKFKILAAASGLLLHGHILAQRITANSSAQECVNLIENIAQTNIGLGDSKVSRVVFSGDRFLAQEDYGSLIFKDDSRNLNWADFDKVDSYPTRDGKAITVEFDFKVPFPSSHNKVRKDTGLIIEKEVDNNKYFTFSIPVSDIAKIKELEMAAERLKTIVKLKPKTFASRSIKSIKNIAGKPTYEETLKFINTFLQNASSSDMFCNSIYYKQRNAEVGEKDEGEVYLVSSYLYDYDYRSTPISKSFSIDLSNVEEIKIVTDAGFRGGCIQIGLWFVKKNESAQPVMHLPLWLGAFDSFNAADWKQTEIYKAFEHLRKLTGAPEPLKF